MRIAVLTSEFPSETFVAHHVADLAQRGHEVDVFPQRLASAPLPAEIAHLERCHPAPQLPPGRTRRIVEATRLARRRPARDVVRLLGSADPLRFGRRGLSLSLLYLQVPFLERRPDYDVVHCHHGPVGLDAAHLQRLGVLRGPLVTSFHGFDTNVAPRRGGRRMYEPLFRRASLLLANSAFLRSRLLALGAPAERVLRHPQGIRPDDFPPAAPATDDAELRIVSVGRLVEVKGFQVALRAVARLAPQLPRLRYVLVGDGPLRGELEALARTLGIASHVQFRGALPHASVRAELARAHLYCQPSVRGNDGAEEGQGLAALEAQASALAVVASRSGGLPESVHDGESGLLVPPGDAAALAAALGALAADPARRTALGRAARRSALARFDRARLTDRLLALYARVARPSFARVRSRAGAPGTQLAP